MRRFPLKRLLLIAVIVGVASASLMVQKIEISVLGIDFNRGDDSILGLRLGLDLEGGSHLIYEARPSEGEEVTEEQMEGVVKTIERRVNAFGVSEPIIQTMGSDRILIQLPGVGNTKGTVDLLGYGDIADIRSVLEEFGRGDAGIEVKDNGRFLIELPSLAAATVGSDGENVGQNEETRIRTALEAKFPAVKANVEFQQPTTTEALLIALEELGHSFANVHERTPTIYTIDFPSLESGEARSRLVEALELTVGYPLVSYSIDMVTLDVTGGVEEAKRLIGRTARLELLERTCLNDPTDISQDCDDSDYHVDSPLNLSGDDLVRAYAGTHPTMGVPVVNLEFSSEGARIFAKHTQEIAGTPNRTAFFLDEELLIAPVALQAITGGKAFIQGQDFTADRVRTIAIQLESGRLQVPLKLIQEQDVDATLGKDSLSKSVVAGAIGLMMVLLFMAMYYRVQGILAALALMVYAIIVLAILKLWPVTLSLGGIAGFILSIGMAVDANILIFERMKEELRTGRTLIAATETGFNRAWPAIRDSNVSTSITCAILFWFGSKLGTGLVTGFALTLFIGVAVSMFSALPVPRALLRAVAVTPLAKYLALYTPIGAQSAKEPDSGGSER